MPTCTRMFIRPAPKSVALIISFALICGLTPVALALSPRPGEPVAVLTLFPDAALPRSVASIDARILWMSAYGHVVILHLARPDLVGGLYRGGATLVLAASPLGGCLPSTPTSSPPRGDPHP